MPLRPLALAALFLALTPACSQPVPSVEPEPVVESELTPAPLALAERTLATNAFWYYQDLDAAERFYTQTLGVELVADYKFAKILQLAPRAYLTLVRAGGTQHGPDEPKTVALALVTEQLDAWSAHLEQAGVTMKYPYEGPREGGPHDGFVAVDPEGYLLEFERFNPHAENQRFTPELDALTPKPTTITHAGEALSFRATVLWLYYEGEGIERAREFYGETLGLPERVDQGWAWIHRACPGGYIGIVDGARGMHQATPEQAVTVSFIVDDVDAWLEQVRDHAAIRLRDGEIEIESDAARTLVGYDPSGYTLEWDTFIEHPFNAELLSRLGGS